MHLTMKTKLYFNLLVFCLLNAGFFFSSSVQGQTLWPVLPNNTQHDVAGTVGELRGNGSRFHAGVDITNGGNLDVHSVVSGTATLGGSGNDKYVRVGNIYHIHVNATVNNGDPVAAGQKIGTMINQASIHVHLQDQGNSAQNPNLIGNLTNYNDNAVPSINSIKIYRNGLLRNNTPAQYSSSVNAGGGSYVTVYNKIDILADVTDPRTAANGTANGGSMAPYNTRFSLIDSAGSTVLPVVENLLFSTKPDNANTNYVFQANASSSAHKFIISNNPFQLPHDRYLNTGLRTGVTESWPNNTTLDARHAQEAEYKDGFYKIRTEISDMDADVTHNSVSNNKYILIDNFNPYIWKAEITPTGMTPYTASWGWNGTALTFSPWDQTTMVLNSEFGATVNVYCTEPMESMNISIPKMNVSTTAMTVVSNTKNMRWKFSLTKAQLTAVTDSIIKLVFTGKDYNGNALLRNAGQNMPVRQSNGSWLPTPVTGTDTNYRFFFCPKPKNLHMISQTLDPNTGNTWINCFDWDSKGATSYIYSINDPVAGGWVDHFANFKPVCWINGQPSTTYDFYITCECGNTLSESSSIVTWTTPALRTTDYNVPPLLQMALSGSGETISKNLQSHFTITPNPVRHGENIRLTGLNADDLILLQDISGKTIESFKNSSSTGMQFTIPNYLETGIYLLRIIKSNAPAYTTKLLVE